MPEPEITTSQHRKTIATYSLEAESLAGQYERLASEIVHRSWIKHLPDIPGLALDIGAGSGRDAAWLCSCGFDVVAVEPAKNLREKAQELHRSHPIQWLDDSLPELSKLTRLGYRYDVILVSAVFMHLLSESSRQRAFRKLASQLKQGGKMIVTLRHGPVPVGRAMAQVSTDELLALGRHHALQVLDFGKSEDEMNREGITWSYVVFQLPDDGTGALPLLRHLILLDDKSSTYKLALLRVLVRIADGCRGAVLNRSDQYVTLPFGLVALFWLKVYKPLLLDNQLRQQPGKQSCGFAKEGFNALGEIGHDLRFGAKLTGRRAQILIMALRDARNTIKNMPAHFLTLPGSDEQVFPCESLAMRKADSLTIDIPFLQAFGEFQVPTHLWDTMTHYACWLEPAITSEWCQIMQGYHARQGETVPLGTIYEALSWNSDERSTNQVRGIVEAMKQNHQAPCCVWTGESLARRQYEVDHCFPYANWFNNDLWNLMPATKQANGSKSNKLPTGELLIFAKPRIQEWWEMAYGSKHLEFQFYMEAIASLPGINARSFDAVFDGVVRQRLHLKYEQQMPEWSVQ